VAGEVAAVPLEHLLDRLRQPVRCQCVKCQRDSRLHRQAGPEVRAWAIQDSGDRLPVPIVRLPRGVTIVKIVTVKTVESVQTRKAA
jgi:hypothetical protein